MIFYVSKMAMSTLSASLRFYIRVYYNDEKFYFCNTFHLFICDERFLRSRRRPPR